MKIDLDIEDVSFVINVLELICSKISMDELTLVSIHQLIKKFKEVKNG